MPMYVKCCQLATQPPHRKQHLPYLSLFCKFLHCSWATCGAHKGANVRQGPGTNRIKTYMPRHLRPGYVYYKVGKLAARMP